MKVFNAEELMKARELLKAFNDCTFEDMIIDDKVLSEKEAVFLDENNYQLNSDILPTILDMIKHITLEKRVVAEWEEGEFLDMHSSPSQKCFRQRTRRWKG